MPPRVGLRVGLLAGLLTDSPALRQRVRLWPQQAQGSAPPGSAVHRQAQQAGQQGAHRADPQPPAAACLRALQRALARQRPPLHRKSWGSRWGQSPGPAGLSPAAPQGGPPPPSPGPACALAAVRRPRGPGPRLRSPDCRERGCRPSAASLSVAGIRPARRWRADAGCRWRAARRPWPGPGQGLEGAAAKRPAGRRPARCRPGPATG